MNALLLATPSARPLLLAQYRDQLLKEGVILATGWLMGAVAVDIALGGFDVIAIFMSYADFELKKHCVEFCTDLRAAGFTGRIMGVGRAEVMRDFNAAGMNPTLGPTSIVGALAALAPVSQRG